MTKKLTTTRLAEITGVSQSTVSRVLNNHRGVNPVKRERVLSAMTELNYTAKDRKRPVGIVICPLPEQKNMLALEFFDTEVTAIGETLDENRIKHQIIHLAAEAKSLTVNYKDFSGFILVNSPSMELIGEIRERRIPLVIASSKAPLFGVSDYDVVGPDELESALAACRYLAKFDTEIGLIISESNRSRVECFQMAMQYLKRPLIKAENIHLAPSTETADFIVILHRLIRQKKILPWMVIDHYEAALSLHPIFEFSNYKVPRDVKILTYSHSVRQNKFPSLFQDPQLLGRKAATRMAEKINHPDDPAHYVKIPMKLVNIERSQS